MTTFQLDGVEVAAMRDRAAERSSAGEGPDLAARLYAGEDLDVEGLAAIFLSRDVTTRELSHAASRREGRVARRIETFSPLYLSNTCDAECLMCGMRKPNQSLRRETASAAAIEAQLDILRDRGLRGVALLTGEYHHGPRRRAMQASVAKALRAALERGFAHVLINIGALDAGEYTELLSGVPRRPDGRVRPKVTMCTFQETYDPAIYARFMGTTPSNPRSRFERRLQNFDRAADAGLCSVNPGVLLGLHRDPAYELLALLLHVRHLLRRGLAVYVSLPRLRKASGAPHLAGISDDDLVRLVAILSLGESSAKVVISTREPPELHRQLLPMIGVLTPGSPGVAPYTQAGARFEVEASQFEVSDHRPIEVILGDILAAGISVDCYEPAHPA